MQCSSCRVPDVSYTQCRMRRFHRGVHRGGGARWTTAYWDWNDKYVPLWRRLGDIPRQLIARSWGRL